MINFVFVSPNFPSRYFKWVESLSRRGIRVLGIGDSPHYDLSPRLTNYLTEYYFLADLSNYEEMKKAIRYFESKYGKIDYLESNNEWWLEQDASLRKEFGINTGFHPEDMRKIKAKSAMKAYFEKAGVKTARYILINGTADRVAALEFIEKVGYPVFVKPDIGVGAAKSYSIKNEADLNKFFMEEFNQTYIMEEYVDGWIMSFDGICNSKSECVFCCSDHFPIPTADVVNLLLDDVYFINPFDLPSYDIDIKEFEQMGRRVVKSFGIQKRMFHIEFFVLNKTKKGLGKKGDIIALECNMRPAGGYTPDLINFAISASVYEIYADVIAFDENRQDMSLTKYYSFAISRRDNHKYEHSNEEIFEKYKDFICAYGRYPKHIADDMGDEYFYGKFTDYQKAWEFDAFIRKQINQEK